MYKFISILYRKIINHFTILNNSYPIIIYSSSENPKKNLIKKLSLWILCKNKNKKYCKECNSCKLLLSNNHPDFVKIFPNNKEFSIKINSIRALLNSIYISSNQDNNKLIYINLIEQLTEEAANALNKLLDNIPKNVYFIFGSNEILQTISSLKSRCISYSLNSQYEYKNFFNLKKIFNISNDILITALRINNNCIFNSNLFLKSKLFYQRNKLLKYIYISFINYDIISLMDVFNNSFIISNINWIILILIDSIKRKYKIKKYLINKDKLPLINYFSKRFNFSQLNNEINSWILLKKNILTINNVNIELILLKKLIYTEFLLLKNKI